ncbi:MAG TPA: hypothetical protein VND45_07455 [Thermoanaerobaculia bacterium]|jgi:hypothetical protein|nr:hypothetical protein [Thermoanaerobaculia bacterium]
MKDLDELLSGAYSPSIAEISVLVREVHVRVGVLATPVIIRVLYDGKSSESYRFQLSAGMKTSPDGETRRTNGRARTEADALRQAIRLLTQDYDDAVRQGKMPHDSWLVAANE